MHSPGDGNPALSVGASYRLSLPVSADLVEVAAGWLPREVYTNLRTAIEVMFESVEVIHQALRERAASPAEWEILYTQERALEALRRTWQEMTEHDR